MTGIIDVYDKEEIYQIQEIRSLRQLKNLFPPSYEVKNNWLFLSTQGSHGTRQTLDDVEDIIADKDVDKHWITVLVVQPRLCNMFYGDIQVGNKDIPYLRQLIKNTLDVIPKTQRGNT